ncbi:MAG TPA: hypothetical protein VM368_10005, partial [Flavisolibacter sp.]|nr:hypothetical protein [Flavisolibacter sp.]
ELGNHEQAERDYKTAVYMVPNRMKSRFELIQFYLSIKDTSNAIFWAKSIMKMPVKIRSNKTDLLLEQTGRFLENIAPNKNVNTK